MIRAEWPAVAPCNSPKTKNSPKRPKADWYWTRECAADSQILRGVLLEQVANDPYKSTQHQPEQHITSCDSCFTNAAALPVFARARDSIIPNSPTVKNATNESGFIH
jgi:hypothetical protein